MAITNSIEQGVITPLSNGQLALFATDTVLGIGCAIYKPNLLKEICLLKNRPLTQPMALLVSSIEAVEDLTQQKLSKDCKTLAKYCWPGALTILVEVGQSALKSHQDWWQLIAPAGYLGVRCPDNQQLLKAIDSLGGAIVATSANLHGDPAPYLPTDLPIELTSYINDIWFPDNCHYSGQASTVVKTDSNSLIILREGFFSAKQLKEILACAKSE